jgi:hypothetical protein
MSYGASLTDSYRQVGTYAATKPIARREETFARSGCNWSPL